MFDIGSVVAKVDADITGFKEGMKNAKNETNGLKDSLSKVGDTIATIGKQAAIMTGVVAAGLGVFLKSASEEANNFNKSMTTLDIIAGRFGVSGQQAQKAAQDLGRELRIGTGSAAESLQNLLKAGLTLDQSTDLLKRFTNEAITGKSSSIDLATAVQNLSFAYATNNSAIGNLSGISENFVNIMDKGREALLAEGMAASEITDDMAKYRGMIDLTNLTMGSAERFTGTLIDKQAELNQKMIELKISVGNALNPVLAKFIDLISGSGIIETISQLANQYGPQLIAAFDQLAQWISDNQELVMAFLEGMGIALGVLLIIGTITALVTALTNPLVLVALAIAALYTAWKTNFWGIRDVMQTVWEFAKNLFENLFKPMFEAFVGWFTERWDYIKSMLTGVWEIIKGVIQVAWGIVYGIITTGLALLQGDWGRAWQQIKQMMSTVWDGLKNIFNGAVDFIKGWGGMVLHNLVKPFEDAWNKIKEFVQKIKDNLDFTKRHSPSVIDIINTGVKLANRAMENLEWNTNLTPNLAAAGIMGGATNSNVNQITISMAGAYIGSDFEAQAMGEKIGDSIIKKLQQNVKF